MAVLDDVKGAATGIFGEANEKIEWGLGFIQKYASFFWIVLIIWAASKVFNLKIKI